MGLDYKTAEYNLRVLAKNLFVVRADGDSYGVVYTPSKNLLASKEDFETICARFVPYPSRARQPGKSFSRHTAEEAAR